MPTPVGVYDHFDRASLDDAIARRNRKRQRRQRHVWRQSMIGVAHARSAYVNALNDGKTTAEATAAYNAYLATLGQAPVVVRPVPRGSVSSAFVDTRSVIAKARAQREAIEAAQQQAPVEVPSVEAQPVETLPADTPPSDPPVDQKVETPDTPGAAGDEPAATTPAVNADEARADGAESSGAGFNDPAPQTAPVPVKPAAKAKGASKDTGRKPKSTPAAKPAASAPVPVEGPTVVGAAADAVLLPAPEPAPAASAPAQRSSIFDDEVTDPDEM